MRNPQTRDEIEQTFARLGIGSASMPSVSGSSMPTMPTFEEVQRQQMAEKHAPPPPTTFLQQLGYGIKSPINLLSSRMGWSEKSPAPTNLAGTAGNIVGSMAGWLGLGVITAATLGKAPAILLGLTGLKATAATSITTGGLLGAYSGWGQEKDTEGIAKEAAMSAAFAAAFVGAGVVWKKAVTPALAMKRDVAKGAKLGYTREQALAQLQPERTSKMIKSAPPEVVDDLFGRVRVGAPKHTPKLDGKVPWEQKRDVLVDMVTRGNKYDQRALEPIYRYANDVFLHGHGREIISKSMTPAGQETFKLLADQPAIKTVTDWAPKGKRKMDALARLHGKIKSKAPEMPAKPKSIRSINAYRDWLLENGVPKEQINAALKTPAATPLHKQPSLGNQVLAAQKQLGTLNQRLNQQYKKHGVKSLRELSQKDPDMAERLIREFDLVDDALSQLLPNVEETAIQHQAGQIMSEWGRRIETQAMNQEAAMKKATGHATRITPRIARPTDRLQEWLNKRGLSTVSEMKDKPKLQAEYKRFAQQSREEGFRLFDVELYPVDVMGPTRIDIANDIRKGTVIAPRVSLSTADEVLLQSPRHEWLHWLPRKILPEPVIRDFRTSYQQKAQFVDTYMGETVKILGKKNVGKLMNRKAGLELRHQVTRAMQDPEVFKTSSDEVKKIATGMRKLYNMLFKEFGIEGVADPTTIKHPSATRFRDHYVPNLLKGLQDPSKVGKAAPKTVKDFFARHVRKGEIPEHMREMDIFELTHKYIRMGANEKFGKPVVDRWNTLFIGSKKKPGLEGLDRSTIAYYEKFRNKFMGVSSHAEQGFDQMLDNFIPDTAKQLFGLDRTGRYSQQISSFVAELAYSGTLGYNPFSAIKNLTQQMTAIAHLDANPLVGIDYWFKAKKALLTPAGKQMAKLNAVITGRMPREALDLQSLSMQNVAGLGKVHKHAFTMFKAADRNNIDTSFMMKMLQQIDEASVTGKAVNMRQAAEQAYSFTMATQFMYGIDSPLFFKGPLGKQLGLLMSWPLNYASLIREQGSSGQWMKAVSMLGLYAFGAEALSQTGLSFRSIHPTETAKGFLPVAMLEEDRGFNVATRIVYSGYQGLKALASGDATAREQAWDNFERSARVLIPYSTAGRRILTTVAAARNDWKIHEESLIKQILKPGESSARLRYEMDLDSPFGDLTGIPVEAVMGMVGPTQAARERWESLDHIRQTDQAYRRLRSQAIDAYLNGDHKLFMDKLQTLYAQFGGEVNVQDILQEINLRGQTAQQRRASSLPEALRGRFE